ncbi:hypothetical protein SAMN02910370_00549 [Lachnospiraceae bacterium XPB1003]|nr:hypothetical protein SAMN02910370_00549 [Lachnospiraceae bacterium XPB1003]
MSAEEEYLDRLLAQAMQPKKSNNETGAAAEKVIIAEVPVSVSSGENSDKIRGSKKENDIFNGKSKGNKDFSLDDVDAEQLAKEIADFEADADESILPGITDAGEDVNTEADLNDEAAEHETAIEGSSNAEALTEDSPDVGQDQAGDSLSAGPVKEEFSEEALLAALNETGPSGGADSLTKDDISGVEDLLTDLDMAMSEENDAVSDTDIAALAGMLPDTDLLGDDLSVDTTNDSGSAETESVHAEMPDIAGMDEIDGLDAVDAESIDDAAKADLGADLDALAGLDALDAMNAMDGEASDTGSAETESVHAEMPDIAGMDEIDGLDAVDAESIDDAAKADLDADLDALAGLDALDAMNAMDGEAMDADSPDIGSPDQSDELDMNEFSDASDMGDLASMDLEDIESRLAEAEAAGNEEIQVPGADGDITDIIGAMEGVDPGLDDIKSVLDKSDQNIAVDAALFDEPDIPDPLAALDDESEGEEDPAAGAKGKKGKKEKKKKDKNKKGGLFAGLFKKKKKGEEEIKPEENYSDEDELDLTSKLDPNDFVSEDAADMPREESDETVAAMFSGLDSIFSDEGAEASAGDDSFFGESALNEPSLSEPAFGETDSSDTGADEAPKMNGGFSGGGGSTDPDGPGDEESAKNKKGKKEKKDNIFKRIFAALMEDPDEDLGAVPEEQETKLSEENKQILSEVDGEEEKPKKEKKKKQPKEKKEKKPKVKKPKKEKVKKPEEPGVKIPRKFKIRTFMTAGSVLAAILVLTILVPSANVMSSARAAYYDQNYKDAFLSMYGKDLNESDKLIYDRSKTIILLDRKYDSYVQYEAMGMRDKALDSLLQGLARYEALRDTAIELDVIENLDATRQKILKALMDDYSISEEEAMEVLTYSPADYSGKVRAAAEGLPYITIDEQVAAVYGTPSNADGNENDQGTTPDETSLNEAEDELYPDLLPEEQEYIEGNSAEPIGETEDVSVTESEEKKKEGYGERQDGTNVTVEIESDQF